VLSALSIAPGSHIVDIGAGAGVFTFSLAEAVGAEGPVYAVEKDPAWLRVLEGHTMRRRCANVRPLLVSKGDPPEIAPIDLAFLSNVLHQIEEPELYLSRLHATLHPRGRLAIIDWRRDAPLGPSVEARLEEGRAREAAVRAGYRPIARYELLEYQYFLVFAACPPK
jgi:predicted methyltransferase